VIDFAGPRAYARTDDPFRKPTRYRLGSIASVKVRLVDFHADDHEKMAMVGGGIGT